jgi:hypothetical protein
MQLTGSEAFYNQPNYDQVTREQLRSSSPPQTPIYTYESGSKWVRLSKDIIFNGSSLALVYTIAIFCLKKLSRSTLNPPSLPKQVVWLTLPIALYNNVYIIAGWLIHPASLPFFFPLARLIEEIDLDEMRESFFREGREVKRVSVQANGYLIDTLIVGKRENLGNGRFIIFSNGNGEVYEARRNDYLELADHLQATIIFYNYASTGRSGGFLPNHEAILVSHQAMHAFAREELGAKEIIDFGHSIGGGIQGENLKTMPLDRKVQYVFVKHMTFATLSGEAQGMVGTIGAAIPYLNWEYSSVESSKALQHREIIVQQGRVTKNQEMTHVSELTERDPVILGNESLAKALFEDPTCCKNKSFILVGEGHNDRIADTSDIAERIRA